MFVGLALVLQLPMVLVIGFLVGVNAGMEAAKSGKKTVDVKAFQAKYWWIDVAVPAAGLAAAGVLLAFGLRDEKDLPPRGPDDGFLGVDRLGSGHDDDQDDHRPRYGDDRRRPGRSDDRAGVSEIKWDFKQ